MVHYCLSSLGLGFSLADPKRRRRPGTGEQLRVSSYAFGWHKSTSLQQWALPLRITSPAADNAISWSMEVVLHIRSVPDISERFSFTTIDTQQHYEDEAMI